MGPEADAPCVHVDPASGRIRLTGPWTVRGLQRRTRALFHDLQVARPERGTHWDLRGTEALDAAGAALLWKAWRRRRPKVLLLRPEQVPLFASLGERPPWPPASLEQRSRLESLGGSALALRGQLQGLLLLLGQLVVDVAALVRQPAHLPWREWSAAIYRSGATALPVTAMVGFLIGVVVSYLSAQQLRTYGANVYIVNLLGISVLRELGPLLAAIIVAGRSGSAITAQIGVMHVTQELDALAALGISRTRRLVLPRVAGLALALPLLVLWTDAMALWGGVLAADLELGLGLPVFLERLPQVVPVANLWIGVAKGAVFGFLIALVACHYGLSVEPNTESLGIGTTRSVVTSITLVLVADAVFAVALSGVGLRGALR